MGCKDSPRISAGAGWVFGCLTALQRSCRLINPPKARNHPSVSLWTPQHVLVSGCLSVAYVPPFPNPSRANPGALPRGWGRAAAPALPGDLCSAWCSLSFRVAMPWQREAAAALITRQRLLIKGSSTLISRRFPSTKARGSGCEFGT